MSAHFTINELLRIENIKIKNIDQILAKQL